MTFLSFVRKAGTSLMVLVFCISPWSGLRAEPPVRKIALLIGIENYQHQDIMGKPLGGCLNDVEDIRQLLTTTSFGFREADIKILRNEQATRAGITAAFREHLIDNHPENASVVFYYAGHGSRMKDATHTEPDGMCQTIVPYDSRGPGTYDITDKEIASWLAELLKKTTDITLIFDSCHSAGVTRGFPAIRLAPDDLRDPPPLPEAASHQEQKLVSPDSKYVVFSACQSSQSAREETFNKVHRGLFTYHLTAAIRNAVGKTTYRDLLDAVRSRFAAVSGQDPNAEGGLNRLLFSATEMLTAPFYLIHKVEGKPVLTGGITLGVMPESVFDVFPPNTKQFPAGKAIARVKVTAVDNTTAKLEIVSSRKPIPDLSRAVEVHHAFGTASFKVCLQIKDHSLEGRVRAAVAGIRGATLVEEPSDSDLVLCQEAPDKDLQLLDSGSGIALSTWAHGQTDPASVVNRVNWWISWATSAAVENPVSRMDITFGVRRMVEPGTKDIRGLLPAAEETFHAGEKVQFYALNRTSEQLHFYVLDFASDGRITQIYPPPGHNDEMLIPNVEWHVNFEATLPKGTSRLRDELKLVVSREVIDYSPILSEGPEVKARDFSQSHNEEELPQDAWATRLRVFDVVSP